MNEIAPQATVVAPANHVFISPHYDDIALSCGGTAALVAEAGKNAVVALLFGDYPDPDQPLTAFAEQMHRQWGMAAEQVIDGRRAEEAASSQILGLRDLYLPFRDAIYRGEAYLNDEQLFGTLAKSDFAIPEQVVAVLTDSGFSATDTRVYAPLASGFHVDHQLGFQIGVLLHRAGWSVWFYEDLPYSLLEGRVADRIEHADEPLEPVAIVDVSSVWTQKIDAIMAYPSQLKVIFEDYVGAGSSREEIDMAMSGYSKIVGHGQNAERFWHISNQV